MKTKITFTAIALLVITIANAQITTVNRNIKKEVTNVDATNLYKDVKRNSQSRTTVLKKIANKSKKGQTNSDWAEPNERDTYHSFIKIPVDAFPGYVKITLTHGDNHLGPQMTVTPDLNERGSIITGSTGKTENKQVRTAHFSVHPGMTYDVEVGPFYNAKSYIPPIPYKLEWEYTGLEDIYEPNDTQKQAKYIDFNKTITAYAIAGHIKYYVAANAENLNDWYSVVVDDNKKIKVNILETPSDIDLDIRLYNASGYSIGISRGYNSVISSRNLGKGVYFIKIQPRGGVLKVQYQSKPIPDHFKKPYKFMVEKL